MPLDRIDRGDEDEIDIDMFRMRLFSLFTLFRMGYMNQEYILTSRDLKYE
jgi:hypothetical protein